MNKIRVAVLLQLIITCFAWAQSSDEQEKSKNIDPMVIEEIQCRGNQTTSCEYISSYLNQLPGDPLKEDEIQYGKLRLSSLIQFKSVDIHLEKGHQRGQMILVIEVEEGDSLLKESSVSLHSYSGYLISRYAGRVTQTNFLGTGKILSAEAIGNLPLNSGIFRSADVQLKYLDPSLFGSSKYYFSIFTSLQHYRYSGLPQSFFDENKISYGFFVGKRVLGFSYFGIGMSWSPVVNGYRKYLLSDGSYFEQDRDLYHSLLINYGLNTEDDPYFPTQGSRLDIHLQKRYYPLTEEYYVTTGGKTTWTGRNGEFWTLSFGSDPGTKDNSSLQDSVPHGFSVRYAKNFIHREYIPDMERGRWYFEAGVTPNYSTLTGFSNTKVEGKTGLRFESKKYGIVDLFALVNSGI